MGTVRPPTSCFFFTNESTLLSTEKNKGDTCFSNSVCAEGLVCTAGQCTLGVQTGGNCVSADTCAGGLVCSQDTVCVQAQPVGGQCRSHHDCATGLRCDLTNSQCQPSSYYL